jgi:membrane-associated phospholipid phosphatase
MTSPSETQPPAVSSRDLFPRLKPISPVWLVLHLVIFGILLLLDSVTFPLLNPALEWIRKKVIFLTYFREFGHFYTTAAGAALVWCVFPERRRAVPYIVAAVLFAGGLMELTKALVGRVRPNESKAALIIKGPFQAESPSLPSGHATVAMANAHAIGLVVPAARPVLYTLAIGTGLHRIEHGRHFLADVYLGFIYGIIFPQLMAFWWRRNERFWDRQLKGRVFRT